VRSFHFAPLLIAAVLAVPAFVAAEPAPLPAPGAPRSGIIGIAAMTGTVFQQGQSSFSGIAVRMRVCGAALLPNIEIMPTFEYWQNTSRIDTYDIETQRRDGTLSADARWLFKHAGWQPYAGAGYGLHFLDDELRAATLHVPHATHALVKGGVEALGGLQFGQGARLGSFLELKFLDVTQYRQFKFNTGLTWNLN